MPTPNLRNFPPLPSQKTRYQRRKTTTNRPNNACPLTTINELPEELILDILDWVFNVEISKASSTHTRPEAIPTLSSLSLTNRRFHRIVSNKLYETYHGHVFPPYLFLRTMVSNPSLAATVQQVEIKPDVCEEPNPHNPYTATAADKRTIKAGIKALAIPNWKDWATDCNEAKGQDSDDMIHAAILMHTPNITVLKTHSSLPNRPYTPSKSIEVLKRCTGKPSFGKVHQFQHLHTLHINARGDTPLHHLAPVFKIQSLHTLQLLHVHSLAGPSPQLPLHNLIPPRSNNLSTLSFQESFIHTSLLATILLSPRRLESFTYSLATDLATDLSPSAEVEYAHHPRPTETPPLTEILAPHRTTLLHLALDFPATDHEEEEEALHTRLPTPSKGLLSFTKLKHLSCPLTALFPSPRQGSLPTLLLPPSLSSLHLIISPPFHPKHHETHNNLYTLLTPIATLPLLRKIKIKSLSPVPPLKSHWTDILVFFSSSHIDLTFQREDEVGDDDDDFDDRGFGDWEDGDGDGDGGHVNSYINHHISGHGSTQSDSDSDSDSEDGDEDEDEDEVDLYSDEEERPSWKKEGKGEKERRREEETRV